MTFLSKLGAIVAIALILGACGSDEGSSSAADQEMIEAIEAELNSDPPPEGFDVDTRCMAEGMVASLGGAENMESEHGLTIADLGTGNGVDEMNLDEATALSLTDRIWGCGDFNGLMLTGLAGEGLDDDQASCLVDKIGETPIKQMIAAGFMGDAGAALEEAAAEELFTIGLAAVADCGITP